MAEPANSTVAGTPEIVIDTRDTAPSDNGRSDLVKSSVELRPRQRRRGIELLRHFGVLGDELQPVAQLLHDLDVFESENAAMSPTAALLTRQAHQLAIARQVDGAWKHFNAARRDVLFHLPDSELKGRWGLVWAEANAKLPGWRLEAAAALSAQVAADESRRRTNLVELQRLVDEYNDNWFQRQRVHAASLRYLGLLTVAALSMMAVAIRFNWFPRLGGSATVMAQPTLSSVGATLGVALLGSLGALVSVFISSLRVSSQDARIEVHRSRVSGYVRPLVGAMSALIVVLVLESGIQSLIMAEGAQVYVWAIVAGFSERLLDRTLNAVTGS